AAARLAAIAGGSERLPRWDEAKHGLDGVVLAEAARGLSPLAFLERVYGMAYWPPGYPLLEFPAFVLFGYRYEGARLLMSVVFAASLGAIYLAGTALHRGRGVLIGMAAALLAASSPFYELYGTIVMLELPGALFTLLALYAYTRMLETD